MLGLIYTEFMDMVEDRFGTETANGMVDAVVDRLDSGGAYTAVGNYGHDEIVQLVVQLGKMSGIPVADLVTVFGSHLFHRFSDRYPELFHNADNVLDFLEQVEHYIHVRVRMLYPQAQLPTFICERSSPTELVMEYRSRRAFGDLAHGLILGCGEHFGERLTVSSTPLDGDPAGVRFVISTDG